MSVISQQPAAESVAQPNYPEAIAFYRQRISADPNAMVNYWQLGVALLLQGNPSEAERTWNFVLSQGTPPQVTQWRSQLVEILAAVATQREAARDWQAALLLRDRISQFAPQDFHNLLAVIHLYLEIGAPDYTLKQALLRGGELLGTQTYSNLNRQFLIAVLEKLVSGEIFHITSLDFLEACFAANILNQTELFQNNPALRVKYALAYRNKGLKNCDNGEFEEAIVAFWKARELEPELPRVQYNLAMAFFSQGRFSEAAELLKTVKETDSDYNSARYILSVIYTPQVRGILQTIYDRAIDKSWKSCKYAQASKTARKALELDPNSVKAYYQLGVSLYYEGLFNSNVDKFYEAQQVFHKIVESKPDWVAIQSKLKTIPYMLEFARKGYSVSADCFTGVMPNWEENLKQFANLPNVKVLEIGCFEGMASCWLLDRILTHPTAKITCIDNFEGVVDRGKNDPNVRKSVEDRFDGNIEKSGAKHKVEKIKGYSQEVMRSLPLNAYDIIYIDGSHLASDVLQDAVLSWGLVKVGGLIIFDDYHFQFPDRPHCNTGVAIDAFMNVFQDKLQTVYRDERQIFLQKTCG